VNVAKRIVVVSLLLIYFRLSLACTIFSVTQGGKVLVGNNEDAPYSFPDKMWFVPASDRAHGRVCFGWYCFAQGGMNDQGLFMDWAVTPNAGKKSDKPPFEGNIVERVLANCATVEEAVALFQQYAYDGNDAHFLIADRAGSSVVGEWIDGQFKPVRKSGPYQLITNFLLSEPERGNYPCRRYTTASKMLDQSGKMTVQDCAAMLKAVSADWTDGDSRGGTKYSNVFDLGNREVYVYYRRNFDKPIRVKLAKELAKGLHEVDLKEAFEKGLENLDDTHKSTAKPKSVDEILRRAVEARGGRAAALNVHSFHARGLADLPWDNSGPVEIFAARPDKLRMTLNMKKLGAYDTGFDGRNAWELLSNQPPRLVKGELLEQMREEAEFFAWFIDPQDYMPRREGAVQKWLEGKECYVVKLAKKSGKELTCYFDVNTLLLSGLIESPRTPTGPTWRRVAFNDYRLTEGFLFPTRVTVQGENEDYKLTLNSIEINHVPDSAFSLKR
jgi:choloylglycine hydrolase